MMKVKLKKTGKLELSDKHREQRVRNWHEFYSELKKELVKNGSM